LTYQRNPPHASVWVQLSWRLTLFLDARSLHTFLLKLTLLLNLDILLLLSLNDFHYKAIDSLGCMTAKKVTCLSLIKHGKHYSISSDGGVT
jgi:hypothetical protein